MKASAHSPIDAEYAEKFGRYIKYLGENVFCENGTGDETLGCKRLPGHNWGGSMTHSSPNISQYSQTDNYMRCQTGYYFWKHYTAWEVGSNGNFQTSDKPIFTIEEVLLNYAEAAWELGRFNQEVADRTINKLRERAGVGLMNVAEIGPDFDPARDKGTAAWTRGYDGKTNYEVDPRPLGDSSRTHDRALRSRFCILRYPPLAQSALLREPPAVWNVG